MLQIKLLLEKPQRPAREKNYRKMPTFNALDIKVIIKEAGKAH
jgi:hypothetical protein